MSDETDPYVTKVNKYTDLIDKLKHNEGPRAISSNEMAARKLKKKVDIKILIKSAPNNPSSNNIFEAALQKSNLSYKFYESFQEL